MYEDRDIADQVDEFENMRRKHKNPIMPSADLDIPDDLLNNLAQESTKKTAPRYYKNSRKHFDKNQAIGFAVATTMFLTLVGVKVGHTLAIDEIRNKIDPTLIEYAVDATHTYEEAFKKNDINVFYGFTPDGNKNIERDSSRNYRFMNEYFDGDADIDFFEYLVGKYGVDEVLKGGISVSRTIKGVADQNDKTVDEFLGGLSVEEWAKNMYNGFAEEHVPSVEGKGL